MAAVASVLAAPLTSTDRLEALLLVARSTKPRGAAAVNLIHQAVSAPGVFFFGELFDVAGVAELSMSSEIHLVAGYQLLCLFSYGTYTDYVHLNRSGCVPELSRDELQKLRQLTLLSLASQHKALSYALLHKAVGIPPDNSRELEDLIIETIYAGLISGKLNELQSRFEIHHVQGRDVPHPSLMSSPALSALSSLSSSTPQLDQIVASLQNWQSCTVSVLQSLQSRMDETRHSAADSALQHQQHRQALLHNLIESQHLLESQQQQQQPKKGKSAANPMDIDDVDNPWAAPKKKATVAGARGSKRSRA
ncbi:uncharacterized protein UMAG_03491 [Mycosarcoma maydis]|uniref:PCI domain-containing protein n=1 Tax=Mycosarcoma maydis TaxID=5270 RepID=A0A0D1E134_MYCMD|nr:uncharacterized protein UMAG_03491 [Ustilago maydis 521]KIS68400.1 hypothetical protein UMAG_03491 [Ustilago maydis 521]|eukprot:XP_011389941.1 hypothetical protein UMAG_03491 [Ustilago maydis 521]